MPVRYTGTAQLDASTTTTIAIRDLTIQLRDTSSVAADKYVRVAEAFDFLQNWGNSLVNVLSADPGPQEWDVLEVIDPSTSNIVARIGSFQPQENPPGTPAGTALMPWSGIAASGFLLCQNVDYPWSTALLYVDGTHIHMPFLDSALPAASGVIWFDPADGNRMKYKP